MARVLVTGGSGFIGSHCILQLLAAGHEVRTTVRKLAREPEVRALFKENGVEPGERLSFAAADLESDAGWPEAVAGCDFVLHVASPFPVERAEARGRAHRAGARRGAARVARGASGAGVKRVVLTSSFAAVGYGHPEQKAPFDETSWTNLDGPGVTAYVKSKTIAERAAWDFVAKEGGIELSVVNPVGVFGPVLGPDLSTSIVIVQRMMDGAMPGCPKLDFGAVDVRDVADLHLRAMTNPAAKGERFLSVAGDFVSILEIARMLKARLGAAAKRVPTRQVPNFAGAAGGAVRLGGEAGRARARQAQERDQRKGQAHARLGAALERRIRRGDGGEPAAPGALEGEPAESGVMIRSAA